MATILLLETGFVLVRVRVMKLVLLESCLKARFPWTLAMPLLCFCDLMSRLLVKLTSISDVIPGGHLLCVKSDGVFPL